MGPRGGAALERASLAGAGARSTARARARRFKRSRKAGASPLAAAASSTPIVLSQAPRAEPASAALTRWRLAAAAGREAGSAPSDIPSLLRTRWGLTLERCRNGRTGHWTIEVGSCRVPFPSGSGAGPSRAGSGTSRKDPPLRRTIGAKASISAALFVLVAPEAGGVRITALNKAATQAGLVQGELLSNARSKVLDLQVRDADPAADRAALEKLGLWCLRYTPRHLGVG